MPPEDAADGKESVSSDFDQNARLRHRAASPGAPRCGAGAQMEPVAGSADPLRWVLPDRRARTHRHRGENAARRQPRCGTIPAMAASFAFPGAPPSGSSRGRGCGMPEDRWIELEDPSSTMRPAYITATIRVRADQPRSWVMRASSRRLAFRRARSCGSAPGGGVEAVGLVGNHELGIAAMAMAMRTRCFIPPLSWCGIVRIAAARKSDFGRSSTARSSAARDEGR
jgi:hypothetical protein